MDFDIDHLLEMLLAAWHAGAPLVHNWSNNPFGAHAWPITPWAGNHQPALNLGHGGYRVQEAQRAERAAPEPRIVAWQEPGGHRRVMFSLSESAAADAYAAAAAIAGGSGFEEQPRL